jgi:hypothetical protein
MTSRQASELRIVLQHIAITQAMFRDAISSFERLADDAGHPVTLIFSDDFTVYESGATRQDLDFIFDRYRADRETDLIDTLRLDQLRDIVWQIRQVLALDSGKQWTPVTIENVAWVLVQYGVDKGGRR